MCVSESKVSILIPVYNAEEYLERCLLSIVKQTYKNIQTIIVNDGSTDRSLKICGDFAEEYSNIEIYNQTNSGVAPTRNKLLSKVSGKYFLFVDADDWIEPDMVEILVNIIESDNVDIAVCGNITEWDNQKSEVIKSIDNVEKYSQNEAIELFLYHKRLNGSLWNKLIKTEIANGVEFDASVSYGEDALFIWECLKRVNSIAMIKAQLYHYQVNYNSISHQKFGPKKLSGHKVWEKFVEDTTYDWKEYNGIAKANFAVSDFWLLVFAARDKYPQDKNIHIFRNNLRSQFRSIHRLKLLSPAKLIIAGCFISSYTLTAILLRATRNYFKF